ncbi:MAG: exopolysaccharide biosynthesis polyprenyl glycosylphosphotransferase [Bacteroidales bacterium]|nr:exopolysaccharide biosynthesis polyprenyl glycosylphosphotransferase [Bacteroidales bacterium]
MNRKLQQAKYLFSDYFAAAIAWMLFFIYRKYLVNPDLFVNPELIFGDPKFYAGIVVIPFFWLILFIIAGAYRKIYRKSRIKEITQTFSTVFIGVVIIFFTLLLDDVVPSYRSYFESFLILFGLQFAITASFRLIITTRTVKKIHHKIIGFNSILVGSNKNAVELFKQLDQQFPSSGNKFIGFVNAKDYKEYLLANHLPHLGHYSDLPKIVRDLNVEEVIIAVERSETQLVEKILTKIEDTDVIIKIIPGMQDYLLGSVRTTSIFTEPLVQISPYMMPPWQESIKRIIDLLASIIAVVILSPVYIFLIAGVKFSSKGPIFYWQERIGLHGKPFMIPKFRSMYVGAEKGTPQLSSENDSRITSFGKFMRKVRLDELPQFFTVIKGEMSLVGYRPERQFFIDQIVQRAPHYRLLFKVKPGITSWGQVKFGYASNVDEMVQRLKYDILYVENMSLAMDFKIMFYTALIIIQGRGK